MGPSYSDVVGNLLRASVPIRQLGDHGRVAVTLAAGRIAAIAFSQDDTNLLWSHPQLSNSDLVKNHPEQLVGGIGGDRLWFAPELAYNWDGKPDWETFANYRAPPEMDPGQYNFITQDSQSIGLHAEGELPVHGTSHRVGFYIDRTIRIAASPLSICHPLMSGVEYVGIESIHTLRIAEATQTGLIDLWHLLQIPAGAVLVVPIKRALGDEADSEPLSYALPGTWSRKSDHIVWRYEGEARAKLGIAAGALTGRSGVFRQLKPGRWCVIVRDFSVDPLAVYGDHPFNQPRTDQVFQAWDGFGFGEMEFHSPALNAECGPRELNESDRLWAFGGTPEMIERIARHLLGVDVGYIFEM